MKGKNIIPVVTAIVILCASCQPFMVRNTVNDRPEDRVVSDVAGEEVDLLESRDPIEKCERVDRPTKMRRQRPRPTARGPRGGIPGR